jgi:leader peptidase (prepilin peptidase) / N-methyltransferase
MTTEALLVLLISPFIGSFVTCVADRLGSSRTLMTARSICESCAAPLDPTDLVPIVSFLTLGGHCRHCGADLPRHLLAGEIGAIVVAVFSVWIVSEAWLWPSCIFGWTLLALGLMDLRYFLLSDILTGFLLIIGLGSAWLLTPETLYDHLIGVVLGFLVFAAIRFAYKRLRHRDGLGLGDVKLMGAIGGWLGWQSLPSLVLVSALAALTMVAIAGLAGRPMASNMRVPFGFYLCLGSWVIFLTGPILPALASV